MKNPVDKLGEMKITQILQKHELGMLCHIKEIFLKNNIKFYLACGTALGCVRHGGYIPWDDDIDIYIYGSDYERVKSIFLSQETGNLQFQDYSTVKGYPYTFPKIVDTSTELIEKSLSHLSYKCGVYIDIFPIFGISENFFVRNIFEAIRYFRYCILKAYYFKYHSLHMKLLNTLCRLLTNPNNIQNKLFQTYTKEFNNSKFLIDPGTFGKNALLCKEYFSDSIFMPFEGNNMPMPNMFHEYLQDYYGDYLKLPSENEQVSRHHIDYLFIPGIKELEE